MQHNSASVIALIRRLLKIDVKAASGLMPFGQDSPLHYVGGYTFDDGKSDAQDAYERDTDGWIVIGD